jgi:hypothetical protein
VNELPSTHALAEAKRLVKEAEGHERLVALREQSASYLDEQGDAEGADRERIAADQERGAARLAWDKADALRGPTQFTDQGLEIPIPTREDFVRNLEKVTAKPAANDEEGDGPAPASS